MLETLKAYNNSDAQRTLAEIVSSLLPNPGIYAETKANATNEPLRANVLFESRKTLGLKEEDNSPSAQSRLLSFLGDQISEKVLGGVSLDEVETRLGLKGDISPDRYQIVVTKFFRQFMIYYRVTEEEMNATLMQPDGVQHLPAETQTGGTLAGPSVYVKNFGKAENKHLLLILSKREGKHQAPFCAWRVFYSEVDLRSARFPVGVLRAFAEVYGISFQLGDLRPAKLYIREVLQAPPGLKEGDWLPADHYLKISRDLRDISRCRIERYTPLGFVIFQLVYCVDMLKYRRDSEKHGCHLPPKSPVGISSRQFF